MNQKNSVLRFLPYFVMHTCKGCLAFSRDMKTTVLVMESQVEKLTSVSDEQLTTYIHLCTHSV